MNRILRLWGEQHCFDRTAAQLIISCCESLLSYVSLAFNQFEFFSHWDGSIGLLGLSQRTWISNECARIIKAWACDEGIPLVYVVQCIGLLWVTYLFGRQARYACVHARLYLFATHWPCLLRCLNNLRVVKLLVILSHLGWLKTLFPGERYNIWLVIVLFHFRDRELWCRIDSVSLPVKIMDSTSRSREHFLSSLIVQSRKNICLSWWWSYSRDVH